MENSVETVLGPLALYLSAAEERAKVAEANYARLITGLSGLIENLPAFVNDNTPPSKGPKLVAKSGHASLVQSASSSDSDLMNSLTNEWITAGKLHKLLTARGIKIAEGTVYNRMRKLSAERPDEVEAAAKPERWRLKFPKVGSGKEPIATPKVSKKRGQSATMPRLRADREIAVAANENTALHPPVLHHGDCLEIMKSIPDGSVDLILADLPYATTGLEIDKAIPLNELWAEYRRVIRKPTGNIVLFGSQPFTTDLISAARDIFRYATVWEKNRSTGFQHAASKPLKQHEDILLFSYGVNISAKRTAKRATYNPQGVIPIKRKAQGVKPVNYLKNAVCGYAEGHEFVGLSNCPTDILRFPKDGVAKGEIVHPFAKPVALLEYLIRTYSNPGDLVLDNTMGSGSTCIAAMGTGRKSIGIEQDEHWFCYARERVAQEQARITRDPSVGGGSTGVVETRCGPEFIGIDGYSGVAKQRIENEGAVNPVGFIDDAGSAGLPSLVAHSLPGKVISQKSSRRNKRIVATSKSRIAPDANLPANDNSDEAQKDILRRDKGFGVVSKRLLQNFSARRESEDFGFADDLIEGANLVVEGENSETLNALRQQGYSVDVIYIDPPYNTGKTSFRYKDRNLDWRSFMMERLTLAKGLLNVEGSILISIDDREHATLRVIADEVFGRRNFLGNFIWRKSPTVKNGKAGISVQHEYVVCYAKGIDKVHFNQEQTSPDYIEKAYTYEDSRGRFRLAPIHKATNKSSFPVTAPNGRIWVKKWNYTATKFKALIENDMIHWGMKGTGIPAKKVYLKPQNEMTKPFGTMLPTDKVGYTGQGGIDLQALGFEKSDFLYPKPVGLIQHLLEMTTKQNSIVLDFFAGSGTTGEAVMRLNAADGGTRRFILCNSDENDICASVTHPRVAKAAEALGDNSVVQFTKTEKIIASEVDERLNAEQSCLPRLFAVSNGAGS
jgi:DNA modification methylase